VANVPPGRVIIPVRVDVTQLEAELARVADALTLAHRGELSLPPEARDRALELVHQLVDGGPGFRGSLRIELEPLPAGGTGDLVARIHLGALFEEFFAAVRAAESDCNHSRSPE